MAVALLTERPATCYSVAKASFERKECTFPTANSTRCAAWPSRGSRLHCQIVAHENKEVAMNWLAKMRAQRAGKAKAERDLKSSI